MAASTASPAASPGARRRAATAGVGRPVTARRIRRRSRVPGRNAHDRRPAERVSTSSRRRPGGTRRN
ncbi:hypothetical protein B5181_23250 [Streptomyces sp. 4F]|nr:hypothetical protein B5181_23250 [Streptomyces sp. 4F]